MKRIIYSLVIVIILGYTSFAISKQNANGNDQSYKFNPGSKVIIKSVSVDVEIRTWIKSEAMIKTVGLDNDEDSPKLTVVQSGNTLNLTVTQKPHISFSARELMIYLTIPENTDIDISSASGDVDVCGLNGNFIFKTASGDALLYKMNGAINISSASGDIISESTEGKLSVQTQSGDIDVDFIGETKISTASGDVILNGENGQVSISTASGDVTLNYKGTNKGITTTTASGNVKITLPRNFAADIECNTGSGDISAKFLSKKNSRTGKHNFQYELDGGGERVTCNTASGDISFFQK